MNQRNELLKLGFGKACEFVFGGIGGWLAGMLVAAGGAGSQIFYYQEGWYRAFGAYLLIPLFVVLAYIFLLPNYPPRPRWVIAILAALPMLITFLVARAYIPPSSSFGVVEFVAFWTFIAQLAATILLGSWFLFWQLRDELYPSSR
ncbi:hypothetical protein [Bradyrhizobium erythrophlei]|uniref:hypothetical protein n=1 Tax=Bradyrhizobium erythrophlei TaxID=1437360 RepID=UPI0012AC566D|nr:hypothetical protein [Bradyrhizobium erythrophlei]